MVIDLAFCFNTRTLRGLNSINPNDIVVTVSTLPTRGHHFKFSVSHPCVKVRSNSFAVRVVNAWNSLPNYVVECTNTHSFKRQLEKVEYQVTYRRNSKVCLAVFLSCVSYI